MKRIYPLLHPKTKAARLAEKAIADVRKYLRRERKKDLPEDADFWDFDCRCGPSESQAQTAHIDDLGARLMKAAEDGLESYFVEVLSRPKRRKVSNRQRRQDCEAKKNA